MAIITLPSRERVQQLLHYDAATGEFTWLPRPREMFSDDRTFHAWNKRFAGKHAGGIDAYGYRLICINRIKIKAHRLAWLYVRGEPVPPQIDHIDMAHGNNRIGNLRMATGSQNMANRAMRSHTISGVRGVDIRRSRFRARIRYDRKLISLGTFASLEEAAKARREAAVRLFGEFARQE